MKGSKIRSRSCAAIPGSVESNRGVVHAIAWDSWLTSPDHRAVIMTEAPVHLKAWNGTSTTGTYVIYMQVWACIVPS